MRIGRLIAIVSIACLALSGMAGLATAQNHIVRGWHAPVPPPMRIDPATGLRPGWHWDYPAAPAANSGTSTGGWYSYSFVWAGYATGVRTIPPYAFGYGASGFDPYSVGADFGSPGYSRQLSQFPDAPKEKLEVQRNHRAEIARRAKEEKISQAHEMAAAKASGKARKNRAAAGVDAEQ